MSLFGGIAQTPPSQGTLHRGRRSIGWLPLVVALGMRDRQLLLTLCGRRSKEQAGKCMRASLQRPQDGCRLVRGKLQQDFGRCPSHPVIEGGASERRTSTSGKAPELCAEHAKDRTMYMYVSPQGVHTRQGWNRSDTWAAHAEEGMVDVRSKGCGHEACNNTPSFRQGGIYTREVCAQHANQALKDATTRRFDGAKRNRARLMLTIRRWKYRLRRSKSD